LYYIEKDSAGKIIGKGYISGNVELAKNQFEVTLEEYNSIEFETQNKEPTQQKQLTREQINGQVVAKIRERYSIDEEFKMHRLGLLDRNNVEYLKYLNYVQQCIDWGENEKKKLDLGVV